MQAYPFLSGWQLGGAVVEGPVNLGVILRKRLTIRGSTLRSRTLDYKGILISEVNSHTLGNIFPAKMRPYALDNRTRYIKIMLVY